MSQVKTNIGKLNSMEVVALARNVVTKMTANANFTTPVPALAAITTAADQLEASINAAIAARSASKLATSTQKDKLTTLHGLLMQEASYVQTTSNGDATKIDSSGFTVRNTPSPIGVLPAPSDLELNANVNPGSMGLKWSPVPGAASYMIERAPDGPEPHAFVGIASPTKTSAVVNSMTSGSRYWFRVAAVNAAGTGLWTLEVSKIAP